MVAAPVGAAIAAGPSTGSVALGSGGEEGATGQSRSARSPDNATMTVMARPNGLVVTVEDVSGSHGNLSVNVSGSTKTERFGPAPNTTRLRISWPKLDGLDLRNATVTATWGSERVGSRTLDARYVKFTGPVLFDGKVLAITVDARGVTDGAKVSIKGTATSTGESRTLTATYDDPSRQLRIPPSEYGQRPLATHPEEIRFEGPGGGPTTDGSVAGNLSAAPTTFSPAASGLAIENPLLIRGEGYDVTVRVDSGALWTNTVDVKTKGRLVVPSSSVVSGDELEVTVELGTERIFDATGDGVATPARNAMIENETSVNVAGLQPASVTAVWVNATGTGAVRRVSGEKVSVYGSSLVFDEGVVEFDTDGTYQFLVVTQGGIVGAENDGQHPARKVGSTNGGPDGSATALPASPLVLGGVLLVIAIALGGGAFVVLRRGGSGSGASATGGASARSRNGANGPGSGTRAAGAGASNGSELRVQVVTGDGRTRFPGRLRYEVRPTGQPGVEGRSGTFEGGETTVDVPGDVCVIRVHRGDDELGAKRINPRNTDVVKFRAKPYEISLRVLDEEGTPLRGARVVAETPDGTRRRDTADRRGQAMLRLPRSAGRTTLRVEADEYRTEEVTEELNGDVSGDVRLVPDRGSLEVSVRVDGTPVPDASVRVEPAGSRGRDRRTDRGRSERTNRQGTAVFADLEPGNYVVRATVEGSTFETARETVQVGGGSGADARLEVPFEFELDPDQRRRLRDVRRRLDGLTTASDRDVAVPHYFASVARALCDAVESIPENGGYVAAADVEPSRAASALVDAAEETAAVVDESMHAKRSVDLFSVCTSLPEAKVTWNGEYDLADFFETLSEPEAGRRRVQDRLEEVNARLTEVEGELASTAPARELSDRIGNTFDLSTADQERAAARAFAALGLLDALDELAEHEQLRERLDTTVF